MPIEQKLLDAATDKVKKSIPDNIYALLTPINLHVAAFATIVKEINNTPNNDASYKIQYSLASIAATLNALGAENSAMVSAFVRTFNAMHAGKCPWTPTTFSKPGTEPNPAVYHLGTLRIYKTNGQIDTERLNTLDALATQEFNNIKLVRQSDLLAQLDNCSQNDAPDNNSGRNANGFISSKAVQKIAAIEAWKEVFNLFSSGYLPCKDDLQRTEPCVDVDFLKLFFTNSVLALHVAILQKLPNKMLIADMGVQMENTNSMR